MKFFNFDNNNGEIILKMHGIIFNGINKTISYARQSKQERERQKDSEPATA
jgi:hypothetical protein